MESLRREDLKPVVKKAPETNMALKKLKKLCGYK